MIELKLNNIDFIVETNISVLEACEYLGFEVPRFCYHQNLSIAGNCRMCLVEIANSPKPVASCALPILNNMKIFVDSPLVKKARENILEALLLKHPLDCPICDQAGECDLQDQSKSFGVDSNRFFFKKRFVDDKLFSPLVKTIMTRCIHCTRCVRFNSELTGNECLGTLTRGASTEIGSYYNNSSLYLSEMSANVVDLCPVGALTLRNYAFKSRPWELKTIESVDLSDGFGSSIYISFKETKIVRIFPKANKELNESFISDKARLCYDSNEMNRQFRDTDNRILTHFLKFATKIKLIINNSLDSENLFFIKTLNFAKNLNFTAYSFPIELNRLNFFINWSYNSIKEFDRDSNICFVVCSNINLENTLIANRLRVKSLLNNFSTFGFSLNFSENSNLNFLNLNFHKLFSSLESKSSVSHFNIDYSNPLFLSNENLSRVNISSSFFQNIIRRIITSAIIIKTQISSNTQSLLNSNILNINSRSLDKSDFFIFLELEDSYNFKRYLSEKLDNKLNSFKDIKNLAINSHFSAIGDYNPQLCLPTEYEQEKVFFNLEDRPQKTSKIFDYAKDGNLLFKQSIYALFHSRLHY